MFKRGTYWAGTGAHQAEFKRLRSALVPVGGPAATPHGELLRAIDGIYYDLKRNGLGNVQAHWDDWVIVCTWREPSSPPSARRGRGCSRSWNGPSRNDIWPRWRGVPGGRCRTTASSGWWTAASWPCNACTATAA